MRVALHALRVREHLAAHRMPAQEFLQPVAQLSLVRKLDEPLIEDDADADIAAF